MRGDMARTWQHFRIVEHPGRQQPITVWRAGAVWWFAATREAADLLITQELTREAASGSGLYNGS